MKKKLTRRLKLLDIFSIASGAMISSGLFVLPALAQPKVGPGLFLSYLLASFIALPTVFSQAELVTAMPKAGGDYFYISRSMGRLVSFFGGLSSWFSLALKASLALVGMSAYLELVLPLSLEIKTVALILCIVFTFLNILGIKEAARAQRFLVFGLLGILTLYVVFGFGSIDIKRYVPFFPLGILPVFTTAGFVFISYGGLTKINSIAEEVENPGRNIPLGMFLSLIIVGLLYSLVVFVSSGLLSSSEIATTLTPISKGAYKFWGSTGAKILSLGAILAFISTANAGIMSSARYPLAMSKDGLLPSFLSKISSKFKTPYYSVLLTGVFMGVAVFLRLEVLVKIASELLIILYLLTNIAVIIMRESKLHNYQPKFYSPLYPGMQILGILGCLLLLAEIGKFLLILTFLLIGIGLLLYLGVKEIKEFALIHVIERILNKELTSGKLSKELKEIIKERDQIIEDRFDALIKESPILDFKEKISKEFLFEKVSEILAKEFNLDKENIYNLFLEREKTSSTVLRTGLAIPHIVVEGENKFKIILVRAKKGIIFSEETPPVKIVFILGGSRDERNFHLRALAAIAQISSAKHFDEKWLKAKNTEELRDIILLAERKRFLEKRI